MKHFAFFLSRSYIHIKNRSNFVNKIKNIILSLIWLSFLGLQLLVWIDPVRASVFGVNAVTDMGASLLSDLIWIPAALVLPFILFSFLGRERSLIIKFFLTFIAACIAGTGLLYLSTFFKYLFILLLIYFVLLLFSAYQGKISVHHLLYTLVILFLAYHYNSQLIPPLGLKSNHGDIKVMSWNIGMDEAGLDSNTMIEFIKKEKPHIICIQEFQTYQRRLLIEELSAMYPYQKWSRRVSDYGGGAILSRLSFLNSELIKINSEYHASSPITITHASVNWQEKRIDVYNCHLHHSANYLLNQFMTDRHFDLYNRKAQKGYMRHRDEAFQLAARLFPVEHPLIVTGDFNDTPNSWVYRLYSKYLKNGFASAGWGLGTTFGEYRLTEKVPLPIKAEKINVLRIDHIFYSNDFRASGARVFKDIRSAHKPQIVTLVPLF